MTCPTCGGTTRPGKVSLQLSGWGQVTNVMELFTGGQSEQLFHHCYFAPDGGGEAVIVLPASEGRQAFHCTQCGTVVVVGKKG